MSATFQDYYETLGLARTANAEDIKLAFRKLARIHHPDVAKDKVTGEAKFKKINEAYEVLGDPEKRKRYDELGPDWQGRPGGPEGNPRARSRTAHGAPDFEFGGTGFSDFFESFFGAGRNGFGTGPDSGERVGGDVEADLLVTLEEALRGATRQVTLRRPGHLGQPERTNTYQVRIPPGVREGQRIRLAGQGSAGQEGGAAGDLYLRVRLARHPDFSVQAADLHCDLVVAPWEAVLGVQAKFATLDGRATLRVPPGSAGDTQLRLRGLGLPRADGTRGDIYATVRIRTPPTVSPEERALWGQLAAISPFKPRGEL